MTSKPYNHLIRLLLVGENGVGKTDLWYKFYSDDFVESHTSTIGMAMDFKIKTLELEGQTVKVQIWDTAAEERFGTITNQFYRTAKGAMLVFDICNHRSFEAIPGLLNNVRQVGTEIVAITLIGNNSDRPDRRQVSVLEAQTFADTNGINFYEVSARDRNNLEKPVHDMCRDVLHHILENTSPPRDKSPLSESTQNQGLRCTVS